MQAKHSHYATVYKILEHPWYPWGVSESILCGDGGWFLSITKQGNEYLCSGAGYKR